VLAYVFWHGAASGVSSTDYEDSLRAFHGTLADHPPTGFLGSAVFGFPDAPWFAAGSGYLDWYRVADFASLGFLNEAAVAGARKAPHDRAARMAGAGFGGLFKLAARDSIRQTIGTWLKKPAGMSYESFLERAGKLVDPERKGLWQRQMNLGPGLEFCALSSNRVEAPDEFGPVVIQLRQVF
jgi:hypothetical protein